MTAFHFAALVERSHWFVGGSSLDLHKKGAIVRTFWTSLFRRIDVFPRRGPTQDVVDLFEFRILFVGDLPRDVVDVRTSGATESLNLLPLFRDQHIRANRTKSQHY